MTRLVVTLAMFLATVARAADDVDPLAPWRDHVTVRNVSTVPDRHTTHAYYLENPESPDGSRVVFFASTKADGQFGDVVVIDRSSGKETVVARGVTTEDAHRVACQQWTMNGQAVAYHDVRDARWGVYVVDLATGAKRTIALDRQLSFGVPTGDTLPVYGMHWNPGAHRGLELANARTGEVKTIFEIDALKAAYGTQIAEAFADKPISVFFPTPSPDGKRVFFKIAAGSGGNDFRTKAASDRGGLVAYDLAENRFLYYRAKWGHPAWMPDSRHILEVGNLLFDASNGGKMTKIPELPYPGGGPHLSASPDGKLFVQDGTTEKFGGKPGEWGIFVCDVRGGADRYALIARFDNTGGATSWRRNHPHPVFSADGKRIYFNVSDSRWTRLCVAEVAP